MKISVVVAQLQVGWDIGGNLAAIRDAVAEARPGAVVVCPEGALSGYGADLSPLDDLDHELLAHARREVAALARREAVHLFCGSLLFEDGAWWNCGLYFSPEGRSWTYRKINLAMNERGRLSAGDRLPVLPVQHAAGEFTVGVQLCREIRFPEQWQHLARSGAEVFVYLTNAAGAGAPAGVWRSHLISRAAENQRFLVAANIAATDQLCPSMVVSPAGEVLAELPAGAVGTLAVQVDLGTVANWYLSQQRRDVLDLRYRPVRSGPDDGGGPA